VCNWKSRNEDHIRYETAIFTNDVKCFRSQPLQIMSRKPFMSRSDKMWGGTSDGAITTSINHDDHRDFSTTYNSSFDSSILRK
jgi:hypothetical protein